MATPRDVGPALQRRLTYLLKHALLELEDLHAVALAPSGVTARELALLLLLDDGEPQSQQQAAGRVGVDRTTMVALLDALEDKALVERRPDVDDRRRNVVGLTDEGRTTLAQATRASDRAEQQLLAVLGDADADRLRSLLERLAAASSD